MPLQVYSARLPHHGQPGYTGPGAFDITRGSGGLRGGFFAPSAQLLGDVQKRKRAAKRDEAKLQAAWDWYVPLYLAEMRASYKAHYSAWRELLARDRVVLLCYCGTAARCHRAILRATILPKMGAVDAGELVTPAATSIARATPVLTPATRGLLDLADEMSRPRKED